MLSSAQYSLFYCVLHGNGCLKQSKLLLLFGNHGRHLQPGKKKQYITMPIYFTILQLVLSSDQVSHIGWILCVYESVCVHAPKDNWSIYLAPPKNIKITLKKYILVYNSQWNLNKVLRHWITSQTSSAIQLQDTVSNFNVKDPINTVFPRNIFTYIIKYFD